MRTSLVYNLKRSINILGISELLEKLQNWPPTTRGLPGFAKNCFVYSTFTLFKILVEE